MKSLLMGLLAVGGALLTLVSPPAGAMVITIVSCWFLWERG